MKKTLVVVWMALIGVNASATVFCGLSKENPTKPGQYDQTIYQGTLDETSNPTIAIKVNGEAVNMREFPDINTQELLEKYKKDFDKSPYFFVSKTGTNLTIGIGTLRFSSTEKSQVDVMVNGASNPYLNVVLPSKGLSLSCASVK